MKPLVGSIVHVRAGAYSVQERCAAIITQSRSETLVDVTVFPGNGVMPFTMKSVAKVADTYRERSNKEIFWHWPPEH